MIRPWCGKRRPSFCPSSSSLRSWPKPAQSSFGGDLANGGQTKAIFGQRLDQVLADGVAGADPGLVNHMVQHFEQFARRTSPGSNQVSWPTRTQLKQQAEGVPS